MTDKWITLDKVKWITLDHAAGDKPIRVKANAIYAVMGHCPLTCVVYYGATHAHVSHSLGEVMEKIAVALG